MLKLSNFTKTSNKIKFELIFLFKFLVYQLDLHHLQGNCVVYIFVNIMKSLFYLSIIRIHFILITSDVHKDLSSLWMKYRNQKVQIVDRFIYIMNWSPKPHLNSVFDLQIKYSEIFLNVLNFVINGKVISLHKVIK